MSGSCRVTCNKICHRLCGCWITGVPPSLLVYAGLFAVQIGFGLYPVVVEAFAGHDHANLVIFSFYRDACCFPLLILCALIGERKFLIPSLKDLLLFAILGVTGMFGNQLLFILGVSFAGADIASVLQNAIPVWAAFFATITCMERFRPTKWFSWTKILGIILTACGSVEISLTQPHSELAQNASQTSGNSTASPSLSNETIGFFLLIGNTVCMAFYVLIQKRFIFKSKTSRWKSYPIMVTAWSYGFGAVAMGLATIYYYNHPDQFVLPGKTWYALVYAVFITSAFCYLLITWANLHLPSTIVTAFWPVQVPVAMVTSAFFLGEVIAPLQYIGAVLVVAGLFLVIISNHWETKYQQKLDREASQTKLEKEPLLADEKKGSIQ